MRNTPTRALQNLVLGSRQSKWTAEQIGKPYSTMMRELNPYDHFTKLGIDDAIKIVKAYQVKYGSDEHATETLDSFYELLGVKPVDKEI